MDIQKYLDKFHEDYRIKIDEYKFFLHITNKVLSKVDYKDEEIYYQDKDMVVFRNGFLKKKE